MGRGKTLIFDLLRYNRSVDRNKVKNKHSAARALIELSSEPAAAAHGSTEDEDSLLVSEINFNADDEQNGDQNLDLESTCDTEVESLRRENIKLKEQLENAKCSGAADSEMQRLLSENMLLKEQINNLKFNEDSFKDQDEKVRYYTGLPGYVTLMALFSFVRGFIPKPKANSELGQFERLLITLMRLKLNFPVQDLAFRFRTSAPTISRTFTSVIHVLYVRLKHLLYWPDRDELHETMPLEFRKHFGKQTAVIIDCFEVFIQRPRNMLARAQTWSSYKHSNTVKFLIGITPQGSISFLSKAWGGRASDKWITENCGILKKLLPGDLVLADRGFDIAESVGICCAQINIPAFTKGKSQLSPVDIETTRKIASVRIHVERVIGLVRNKYTMLQSRLPVDYLLSDNELPVIDKIAVVACALSNMCPSVVPFN